MWEEGSRVCLGWGEHSLVSHDHISLPPQIILHSYSTQYTHAHAYLLPNSHNYTPCIHIPHTPTHTSMSYGCVGSGILSAGSSCCLYYTPQVAVHVGRRDEVPGAGDREERDGVQGGRGGREGSGGVQCRREGSMCVEGEGKERQFGGREESECRGRGGK